MLILFLLSLVLENEYFLCSTILGSGVVDCERIVSHMLELFLIELLFAAAHFHSSSRKLLYLVDGIQKKMK